MLPFSRPCQSQALHLVSAGFGTPFLAPARDAVVAQLVRAPVCGTGGRWFEPTQLYQQDQALTSDPELRRFPEIPNWEAAGKDQSYFLRLRRALALPIYTIAR
jgi:hypothetical protein